VGIASGGTNISRRIAVLLGLQHHEIYISCYTDKGKRPYPIVRGDFDTSKRTLVVDDMIDGGSTIALFKLHYGLKESDGVAVLFWNTDAPEPDFFVEEKPDEWLIFPWELNCEEN
jgi:hypoxanthine phosphoribosyltransferase